MTLSVKCAVKVLVTFPAKRNPMISRQINIVHELIITPSLEFYVCKLIYISNLIIIIFRVYLRHFGNDFLLQRSQCLDLVLLYTRSENHQFASACYYLCVCFIINLGSGPSVYSACACIYTFTFKGECLHFAVTDFGDLVIIRVFASHRQECPVIDSIIAALDVSVEYSSNALSFVCS